MDDKRDEWPGTPEPLERSFVGHIHPDAMDPLDAKTVWPAPFEGSVPATLVPHVPEALADLAGRLTRTMRANQFEPLEVQVEAVVACIKGAPAIDGLRHAA